MITHITSIVPLGVQAVPAEVEVDINPGIPQLTIVGLPDQAVKESKDRVRAALKNSGFQFPLKKVTVNLAPADLKKEGPLFDLPIALCILAQEGHIQPDSLNKIIAVGELALDGKLRPVKGLIQTSKLAETQEKILLFPARNAKEAALLDWNPKKPKLIPLNSLKDAISYLNEGSFSFSFFQDETVSPLDDEGLDFKDVKGQDKAKRAIETAVSGGHNLLMLGSPGGGKTMLAKRVPSILPILNKNEALEVFMIYGISDESDKTYHSYFKRPFRSPHHTLSTASLVGGGALPKPGEVSMAHRGVLFLDELSEFRKDALESLRLPLEDKKITISRVNGTLEFPASFMLVSASNPCKCGYLNSKHRSCRCTIAQIEQFRSRLSGPLIDRIDIQIEVPEVSWEDLRSQDEAESSETIRNRINEVRIIQKKRFEDFPFSTNSEMNEKALKLFCQLDLESETFLRNALKELGLSARAHTRILKIARTLADMANSEYIGVTHLEEATSYRLLDRQYIYV